MVPGFLVNGNALPIVEFGDMQDLMPLWELCLHGDPRLSEVEIPERM